MELIKVEHEERVAILELNNGITNAISPQLIQELNDLLMKERGNPNTHGIVITSSNDKFFSIGLDIPTLFDLSREEFTEFYHSFNTLSMDLFTSSKPTIASISGHAIAGGCILALCCDFRFIAEGHKLMGLNEIKLGVPVPYPADCILMQIVNPRVAKEITISGDFYEPEQLRQFGMVDQVLPLDQVLSRSIEKVKLIGSYSKNAFQIIKKNRIEMTEQRIMAVLPEKEKYFIDCWYSNRTRKNLKNALKKY